MQVPFVKMHGTGNDFVLIEDLGGVLDIEPQEVSRLCHRHLGIGADGIIVVRRSADAQGHYMHYVNADGSPAEMCGNGIRCFAKYLIDRGLETADTFEVQTLGGPRSISVKRDADGRFESATVDMGAPVLEPSEIPVEYDGDLMQDVPVDTPEGILSITAVSMGNPHAVVFVDDVDAVSVGRVGPFIENLPMFPNRTNVEFVQVCSPERLQLRVWERGVGETLACGTGACAAVIAAYLDCLVDRRVVVELPGGELTITWAADDRVLLTGTATEVFSGTVDLS